MNSMTENRLETVKAVLTKAQTYRHAASLVSFDLETICPKKGMEEQSEVLAFLESEAFALLKDESFIEAAEYLYEHRDELSEMDRVLAESLHRDYIRTKNLSAQENERLSKIYAKSYVDWLKAKETSDYQTFLPSFTAIRDSELYKISLLDEQPADAYDYLLDSYERGIDQKQLDAIFAACRERLLPLLKRIMASKKVIRTDFLQRPITDEQQAKFARRLLNVIGFDLERGVMSTTEHPFTDSMGRNDERVTTNYDPENFTASMYSIVHEGGHALFDQNQPQENWDHFITGNKTMGMHESVSRFYENMIGRSEAFIDLIYPIAKECFPDVLCDVSPRELYECVNQVRPSLIRTDADEFTYTLHIMIRYELEKLIVSKQADLKDMPKLWDDKYEEYLGIRPSCDRDGVLQDVHWSFGLGYFPTYAIGNFYNAMYVEKMREELDVDALVRAGRFDVINGWMKEHVFSKADRLTPNEWIQEITGKSLSPDAYLDYLEKKYTRLYEL